MVAAVPTLTPPVAVVTPVILTFARNLASVAVCILSVLATPVSPEPSPEKVVAVIIPTLKSLVVDNAVLKPARSDILDILLPF